MGHRPVRVPGDARQDGRAQLLCQRADRVGGPAGLAPAPPVCQEAGPVGDGVDQVERFRQDQPRESHRAADGHVEAKGVVDRVLDYR